jgi:putative FmdB family regulatory protein
MSMPTYAYRCKNCEHEFEIRQRITEDSLTECPECKGTLTKLLFPVGIVFKGSGFHVNDYPSSKSDTSGNGKKAEEKAESKPEPKETAAASKD